VLALFDREIVGKEGTERRELTTKRNTLLIALGVKSPTAKTPSPPVPTPQRAPLASPEQLKVYVAELRKAVVGTAR
jgi:outer membrane protein TolC